MVFRLIIILWFGIMGYSKSYSQAFGIIPQPQEIIFNEGNLKTTSCYRVVYDAPSFQLNNEIWQALLQHANIKICTHQKHPTIHLQLLPKDNLKTFESYSIVSNKDGIFIKASSKNGLYYGMNSLVQLLAHYKSAVNYLPFLEINDEPAYSWRGLMLDEARHFFGKEVVKEILDWMAFYKLNTLHWHLTDEQGWRLQIKSYPLLTTIGSKGNFSNPYADTSYYTQEDIKEIIEYANARMITVIPEIDMPGHATAANKAYPFLSGGGTKDHPDFTFHPAKPSTYHFLTTVVDEAIQLFQTDKLHLGGDEVAFGSQAWLNDTLIQQLKSQENLKDNKAVEIYFMKKMAAEVYQRQSKLLVWDEMTSAKLPTDKTIIYWWRHDKPEILDSALQLGYSVVVCPRIPFYFDFVQDSSHRHGRKWGKAFVSIEDLYQFDIKSQIRANHQSQILGMQANIWTERIHTKERLQFMLFPRIAALAENTWTKAENKNYKAFNTNLNKHQILYDKLGIYYFKPNQSEPTGPTVIKPYID